MFTWTPEIADPDPYAILHSSQIQDGSNYAAYASADVDRLLDEGRRATDRAERRKSYFAIPKIVHEEEPYTFLFSPEARFAWSRRVHGANPVDFGAMPTFPGLARWWVAK